MNVALPRKRMTVSEFLAWWETAGGDDRFELVDGMVVAIGRDRVSHNRAKMPPVTARGVWAHRRFWRSRPMGSRLPAAGAGLLLLLGFDIGTASAAEETTVQSLVSDGYTVASAWMSQIGPVLVLQKNDKLSLCFVTERPDTPDVVAKYCKPVH